METETRKNMWLENNVTFPEYSNGIIHDRWYNEVDERR